MSVLSPTQKLEFLVLEGDLFTMTLTLPMEKSEEFDSGIQKFDQKSQNNLVGKKQARQVHFGQLHSISCQSFYKQIKYTKRQLSYQSLVHLYENSIQELVWWVNNLEMSSGKHILSPTKQNYSSIGSFTGRFGNMFPENVRRESMDPSRVKVTNQSIRTQSYKFGFINFSQNILSESSLFLSGQHN